MDNNQFLDQMEKYYAQSDGVKDARPEVCACVCFARVNQNRHINIVLFFTCVRCIRVQGELRVV